MIIMPFGNCY